MNVLFVCTGNTCRSAMAEVIRRDMAKRYDLPLEVDSAGLSVKPGTPCPDCAIFAVRELGLSLEDHLPRMLTGTSVTWADAVIAMTERTRATLIRLYPAIWHKCATLGQSIEDPCGRDYEAYRCCVQTLRVLLIKWIAEQHFPGVSWKEAFNRNRMISGRS